MSQTWPGICIKLRENPALARLLFYLWCFVSGFVIRIDSLWLVGLIIFAVGLFYSLHKGIWSKEEHIFMWVFSLVGGMMLHGLLFGNLF